MWPTSFELMLNGQRPPHSKQCLDWNKRIKFQEYFQTDILYVEDMSTTAWSVAWGLIFDSLDQAKFSQIEDSVKSVVAHETSAIKTNVTLTLHEDQNSIKAQIVAGDQTAATALKNTVQNFLLQTLQSKLETECTESGVSDIPTLTALSTPTTKPTSCICPPETDKNLGKLNGPHMRALFQNGTISDSDQRHSQTSISEAKTFVGSGVDSHVPTESGEDCLMGWVRNNTASGTLAPTDRSVSNNAHLEKPASCIRSLEQFQAEASVPPPAARIKTSVQESSSPASMNGLQPKLIPMAQPEPTQQMPGEDDTHRTSELNFLKPTVVAALIPSIILPSLLLWQQDLDWISVFGIPSWIFQTIFYIICYVATLILISTWIIEFDLTPALKREFVQRVSRFLFAINIAVCVFSNDTEDRSPIVRRRATPLFFAYVLSFIGFSLVINHRWDGESQRMAFMLSAVAFFFYVYTRSVADSIVFQTLIFFAVVDILLFFALLNHPGRSRAYEDQFFKYIAFAAAIGFEVLSQRLPSENLTLLNEDVE